MLIHSKKHNTRIVKMDMSILGINYLHRSNPWTATWWSAAFPGCGHLYLGSIIKGLLLMSAEILINIKGNINLAIYYTFIGNIESARDVFNIQWGLFYMAVWIFSIYDAHILSIELNQLCKLEELQERRYFKKNQVSSLNITYIIQRQPLLSAFFSILAGGMGQIYNFQFLKGFVLLAWVIIINHYAQFNQLIYNFISGNEIPLHQVNWQWLLNVPSIFVFSVWDSYVGAVEINKLSIEEQRYRYGTKKRLDAWGGTKLYPLCLIGTSKGAIDHKSIVNSLKEYGLDKYEVVLVDVLKDHKKKTGDSIQESDGINNFNGSMCGAAVFMLLGTMWGKANTTGGPIAIGLAGFLIGSVIGYLLDRFAIGWMTKKWMTKSTKGSNSSYGEVIILIKVQNKDQYDFITTVFTEKDVMFVGMIEKENEKFRI